MATPKIKIVFVRGLNMSKIEQVRDGFKRTLEVTDKDGNNIYLEFKGAERKHLLITGLKNND